jgi:hypothetical protein
MNAVDVLVKAIQRAFLYGRIGKPGYIIETLSEEEREKLKTLTSDDAGRMRLDK